MTNNRYSFSDDMQFWYDISDKDFNNFYNIKSLENARVVNGYLYFSVKLSELPDYSTMTENSNGKYTYYMSVSALKEDEIGNDKTNYVMKNMPFYLRFDPAGFPFFESTGEPDDYPDDLEDDNVVDNTTIDNTTTDNTTENNTTTNNTIANNTTKNNTTTNNTTTNNTSNSNSDSKYKTVTGETDITVADKDIPQTGEKDFFVGFGSTFIIGIGLISFVNYKRIRIK